VADKESLRSPLSRFLFNVIIHSEAMIPIAGKKRTPHCLESAHRPIKGSKIEKLVVKQEVPGWIETNYHETGPFLGRVNIFSLYPTLLIVISVFYFLFISLGKMSDAKYFDIQTKKILVLLFFAIGFTIIGYLWFLIQYPNIGKGDTIKATYLLHIFPLLSIITAVFLTRISEKHRHIYYFLIAGLIIVYIHNFPVFLTNY